MREEVVERLARRRTGHNRQVLAHWDDVESGRAEAGHLAGLVDGSRLGGRDEDGRRQRGSRSIQASGRRRSTARPGRRRSSSSSAGSGVCLLAGRRLRGGAGDCIVHRVGQTHTLRAGDDGLDVLAFGERGETEAAHLPRAGVSWLGGSWVEAGTGAAPVGARGRGGRAGAAGARPAPATRRPRRRRRGRPRRRQLAAVGAAGRARSARA